MNICIKAQFLVLYKLLLLNLATADERNATQGEAPTPKGALRRNPKPLKGL